MSCELICGYELQLSADVYFPPAHTVTRHIGANETFYIIKDEDKMGASGEEKYYVQVAMLLSLHIKLITINITGYATMFFNCSDSSHLQQWRIKLGSVWKSW